MPLKRTDVVTAALELLDAEGLDGLTMRELGARLGVRADAIHGLFKDKDALLGAMADRITAAITETPFDDGPWDAQLVELAHRARGALLAHRDGARVVAGTSVVEPNTVRGGEAALRALADAGMPIERAGWVVFALLHYVLGHTIEEQAERSGDQARDAGSDNRLHHAMDSVRKAAPEARFAFGLELFVDGVRVRLAAAQA
ncbi:TetR/AcrR family transcriptional regulator C-terminal domain-containing protein [Amycolatopsis sp. DSM 110486]|uniref:TetR/AcrR family transcriptional regulator C-terminal domain-containing protein n=1 Tax=Amycolatopsis sp. DSM 110486 TaxID=2865832 RepID=UPI001C6A6393|nr:TetR/AcrR family transcriptional regulator C-terminal domain-containing protein [Amycolatopsis sp. DSM 110486]QYN24779.1 TetR/AcrR family transcriptional regulator C-terminal domain-containing protein [Amycolatopsis sp. DSM 110486]